MIFSPDYFQILTQDLIYSGKYDTRDDFTVVLQPFFRNTELPRTEVGWCYYFIITNQVLFICLKTNQPHQIPFRVKFLTALIPTVPYCYVAPGFYQGCSSFVACNTERHCEENYRFSTWDEDFGVTCDISGNSQNIPQTKLHYPSSGVSPVHCKIFAKKVCIIYPYVFFFFSFFLLLVRTNKVSTNWRCHNLKINNKRKKKLKYYFMNHIPV